MKFRVLIQDMEGIIGKDDVEGLGLEMKMRLVNIVYLRIGEDLDKDEEFSFDRF